jgi:selenide,water dikinase
MDLVRDGLVPAGCYRNRDHYRPFLRDNGVEAEDLLPLFDPQTSGGLLISLPPEGAARFMERAASRGCFAARVGEVVPRGEKLVEIS